MLDKIRRRVVKACENTEDFSSVGRLFNIYNNIRYAGSLDDVEVGQQEPAESLCWTARTRLQIHYHS